MKFVQGGIGDMLQALPQAIEEGSILVSSHYPGAENIFIPFGVSVTRYEHFKMNQSPEEVAKGYQIEEARRDFFLPASVVTPLGSTNSAIARLTAVNKPIIGIHPVGSKFANAYWFQRGQPIKYMPKAFIKEITSNKDFHYLLFGTHDEISEYEDILDENITPIECDHIWDSLAFVDFCDGVIGVDSAIKAYSAMRKIPTLTLVGDFPDEMRDELFLMPYYAEEVMDIISYRAIGEAEAKATQRWMSKLVKK